MEYKINPWTIILTIAITVAVGVGGYSVFQKQNSDTTTNAIDNKPVVAEPNDKGTAKKTYVSKEYSLSFQYPATGWDVSEDVIHLVAYPLNGLLSTYFEIEELDKQYSPDGLRKKNTLLLSMQHLEIIKKQTLPSMVRRRI